MFTSTSNWRIVAAPSLAASAFSARAGDVNAERFIALTNREKQDYTAWREKHMYIGETVRETAARAKAAAARLNSATTRVQ